MNWFGCLFRCLSDKNTRRHFIDERTKFKGNCVESTSKWDTRESPSVARRWNDVIHVWCVYSWPIEGNFRQIVQLR